MGFLKRADGEPIKGEHPLRHMMPYIMPTRNESVVYFEQTLEVSNVLAYVEKNPSVTLFHFSLTCLVRVLSQRPKMNRFVSGGRLYHRNKIALSFAVKKKMHDDANMTAVKINFEGHETVFEVAQKIDKIIAVGRGNKDTTAEKEMGVITRLPGFLVRFLVKLQRTLDAWNLLPAFMTKNDPLYASMFVANLGSLKVDAPFHHLYEYGTVSLFAVIGNVKKIPVVDENNTVVVKEVVLFRYTIDERITDGYYAAQALKLMEQYFRNPEELGS